MSTDRLILLTGATGYVGGRLLSRLQADGRRVRCLTRGSVLGRPIGSRTEVVRGDVRDEPSLRPALVGVHTAYYLVHSLGSSNDFAEEDRRAARCFADAAREAGVARIVYLGGLGSGDELSAHLASRQEVGAILRASGVPTLELRASIVVGAGSPSFELLRALVDRLPVMVTPLWVRTPTQPIAIDDVVAYLIAALDVDAGNSRVFEIGGADQISYGELMREYARARRVRRLLVPVPVLTPRLSALWLRLVAPRHAAVGRELVEGLRNETIAHDTAALSAFPIQPRGAREAIELALGATARSRPRVSDSRTIHVSLPPWAAFAPIRRIGGRTGWYAGRPLWRLRGAIDALLGGPGLRRGRRSLDAISVADAVDFWRVAAFEPDRLLTLEAEMRLPGRAWLEFEVRPAPGGAIIRQTATFEPRGPLGRLYWHALAAVHSVLFAAMLRGIVRAADDLSRAAGPSPGSGSRSDRAAA